MSTELILLFCVVVSGVTSWCFLRALRKFNAFLDGFRGCRPSALERDRQHEMGRRQWAALKARRNCKPVKSGGLR